MELPFAEAWRSILAKGTGWKFGKSILVQWFLATGPEFKLGSLAQTGTALLAEVERVLLQSKFLLGCVPQFVDGMLTVGPGVRERVDEVVMHHLAGGKPGSDSVTGSGLPARLFWSLPSRYKPVELVLRKAKFGPALVGDQEPALKFRYENYRNFDERMARLLVLADSVSAMWLQGNCDLASGFRGGKLDPKFGGKFVPLSKLHWAWVKDMVIASWLAALVEMGICNCEDVQSLELRGAGDVEWVGFEGEHAGALRRAFIIMRAAWRYRTGGDWVLDGKVVVEKTDRREAMMKASRCWVGTEDLGRYFVIPAQSTSRKALFGVDAGFGIGGNFVITSIWENSNMGVWPMCGLRPDCYSRRVEGDGGLFFNFGTGGWTVAEDGKGKYRVLGVSSSRHAVAIQQLTLLLGLPRWRHGCSLLVHRMQQMGITPDQYSAFVPFMPVPIATLVELDPVIKSYFDMESGKPFESMTAFTEEAMAKFVALAKVSPWSLFVYKGLATLDQKSPKAGIGYFGTFFV